MKRKLLSLLLASTMAVTLLAGCGDKANKDTTDDQGGQQTETDDTGDTGEADNTGGGSDTPLVVGYSAFSSKFSPFFATTAYDQDASTMTQAALIGNDRAGGIIYTGIEGQKAEYNGTEYTYYSPSNVDVSIDDTTGDTTYTIKLREDMTFSDGKPVTIDDVIFSMYVLCDTDYDGSSTLYSLPIKGMKAYRANSTAADSVTAEMIAAKITEMPEELAAQITENVVSPVLTAEFDWVVSDVVPDPTAYGLEADMTAAQCYAALYSLEEGYSVDGKDDATVVADIIAQYGSNYKALANNYAGDETYFDADVQALAEAAVIADLMAGGQGEEVANISGITRVDDYTLQVVTDGFDAVAIYQLGVNIAPLHYYGDEALYDYENNSFGFTRGDLSIVRTKTETPMGAGPYVFDKYENKTIYYTANPNYYLGAPKIQNVQFKETNETEKVAGVEQGTIDLTDPSGSKDTFEQISGINGGDLNGDKIITNRVDNLGYGYLGANADTVNVNGEPASDASKNLRKALMTIFAVYRDVNIDSYYGDAASIINYPISNTSWAAPQKSDPDYQLAYSTDVDGNPIYTDGMSAEEKYAAASQAALGFLEAAGYTVADGKVTAAPEGAKTEFEVIIPAEGGSDHPAFGILTDAKQAFEAIGITLEVNNPSDSNVLWDKLDAGAQEFWTAAWQATIDPDMYQVYHSTNIVGKGGTNSNHYHVADEELDNLIMEARTSDDQAFRKAEYKLCLDILLDWAVELPTYQRQNCVIYSPERINADTVTPDITPFYGWMAEIQNFEMN